MDVNAQAPMNDMGAASAAQTLRAVMRFLWVLRRRSGLVVTCILVAALLGGLYYTTATRVYEASASLLIEFLGGDAALGGPMESLSNDTLQTYERLFTSDVVINGAIAKLERYPPELDRSMPRERWTNMLRDTLSTSRERGTNIIQVSCRSADREACVEVVNAIVAAYLAFMEDNQKSAVVEVVKGLDTERVDLEKQLDQRSTDLLDAKRQCGDIGIATTDVSKHPIVQRAIQLSQSLIDVQQRRIKLDAALTVIRDAVHKDGNFAQHVLDLEPVMGTQFVEQILGVKPDELRYLYALKDRYVEKQTQLANLSLHFGENHPDILEAQQSIQVMSQSISDIESRVDGRTQGRLDRSVGQEVIARIEESLAASWQQENALQQQYMLSEQDAIGLNDRLAVVLNVERDLQRLHKQHESLLERLAKIDLNQTQTRIRVAPVREPQIPLGPSSPKLKQIGLLAFVLGFGGAVGIVYLLDLLDDRFRSPEEIKEQLGVQTLVAVRKLEPRDGVGLETLQLYVAPDAVESEAFRTLRTTLSLGRDERDRLAITSSEPGDGKTTISSNLAVSYAKAGKRTLIIDADMRKPGLSKLFGVRRLAGLSDLLRSDEDLAAMAEQRIRSTGLPNLDMLPCGPKPADPAELLSSARFSDLIAWAETHYDQVLVDCPPVLAASDAAIVGRHTDGIVLVVQPEKNHRRLVVRAAEELISMGVDLAAVVANRIDTAKDSGYGYGAGYGYGYGYGIGYGEHGYGETHAEDESEDDYEESVGAPARVESSPPKAKTPRRRAA